MIVKLAQGSEEWLAFRRDHITATDASAIMSLNPYENMNDIWEDKHLMRPPKVKTPAMERGNLLEPEARELFNEIYGLFMHPEVVVSDENWWQMASLDGMMNYGRSSTMIQEIKCPKEATHVMACEGNILDYYMCQMQHQFKCTCAEICYYCSYRPEYHQKLAVIEVFPDYEFIELMCEKEWEFFKNHVCMLTRPQGPWRLNFRMDAMQRINV